MDGQNEAEGLVSWIFLKQLAQIGEWMNGWRDGRWIGRWMAWFLQQPREGEEKLMQLDGWADGLLLVRFWIRCPQSAAWTTAAAATQALFLHNLYSWVDGWAKSFPWQAEEESRRLLQSEGWRDE
mmetsp:Transcript_19413/g.54267  ORF Transcript_19413/g.54267 Transcript_19413/m.54267 type:complete len:125 (+) Transcript_19413:2083-2457(+)